MPRMNDTEALVRRGIRPPGAECAPIVPPTRVDTADECKPTGPGQYAKVTGPGKETDPGVELHKPPQAG